MGSAKVSCGLVVVQRAYCCSTVVQRSYCCSVVTVVKVNSVQALTLRYSTEKHLRPCDGGALAIGGRVHRGSAGRARGA